MRVFQSLNLHWYFRDGFDETVITEPVEREDALYQQVNVPHTVQEIPYDCFDQTMTCRISTYVRHFQLPDLKGKRVLVSFEGVSAYYDLYCNGRWIGSHKGAYSMALYDLTPAALEGENRLVLRVDSNERADIPPNGSTVDYLIYGGIYRDVTLYLQEDIYLRQPLLRYELSGEDAILQPELLITRAGDAGEAAPVVVELTVRAPESGEVVLTHRSVGAAQPGESSLFPGPVTLHQVRRWDTEDPALYTVEVKLSEESGKELDQDSVTVGFREIEVRPDGFFLNGKHRKLIGLNRHQSFPYVGYALGKRSQEKDAEILRSFLGVNMVRCSHYMQSKYFLDRCDALGLLVFEEVPGWGYVGDEAFREVVFQDLRNMVLGHYNHPSIVIWGTRLNETTDHDDLYRQTHQLCKQLDPSRLTSGARWDTGSHLIEDIYSFNDYSEDEKGEFVLLTSQEASGTEKKVPYLISEHSGAILPTKPWDSEERQEQFALRHAKVINKVRSMDDYLGALGWCLCDYNTHNDHNSLEKICYHGVLDMYRVPKMAAYLYASQKSPAEQVVLEPCSMVGRGERCEPVPFWVLTNCDYIDVTLSDDCTRRYYPSVKYGAMAHPPIEVKENGAFWQGRWHGASIVGYVDGKVAARRVYSDNSRLSALQVETDAPALPGVREDAAYTIALSADTADETRVVAYFVDENGNRLYYHRGILQVETEGELELLGPNLIPAMGGAAAFWVRSTGSGKKGQAAIRLQCDRAQVPEAWVVVELG